MRREQPHEAVEKATYAEREQQNQKQCRDAHAAPCMLSLRDRGAENSSGTMAWEKKEKIVAKIPQWEWKSLI